MRLVTRFRILRLYTLAFVFVLSMLWIGKPQDLRAQQTDGTIIHLPVILAAEQNEDGAEVLSASQGTNTVILSVAQDSFLRSGDSNTNEGANPNMVVRDSGNNRALLSFTLAGQGLSPTDVLTATLRLYVVYNGDNWGNQGRSIDAHRITSSWSEGSGANLQPGNMTQSTFSAIQTRGNGTGSTWKCAEDVQISNSKTDCAVPWNGGNFVTPPSASVTIYKDFAGNSSLPPTIKTMGWIEFDLTSDVVACLDSQDISCSWMVKKTLEGQEGRVEFASKEGVVGSYNSLYGQDVTPQLVIVARGSDQKVALGGAHSCGVTESGGLQCWGSIASGTPSEVQGLASGIKAVSAGSDTTCVLTDSGGVKCWGLNSDGQLGDGTTASSSIPVDVVGLESGVSSIAAGYVHACALLDTGGVKCWGSNFVGGLGDGTFSTSAIPVDVVGLSSGVAAISSGMYQTCALLSSGGVKCWGYNGNGLLGDGTETHRNTPVDVIGLSTGVKSISVGGYQACAITTTGALKCWGYNAYGQLGDGTTDNRLTPNDVLDMSVGVEVVQVGHVHVCALRNDGSVRCWGHNEYGGQLGDGTTTNRYVPTDVIGLSSGVSAIYSGAWHNCAVMDTGGLKCWGANGFGQLGTGSYADQYVPVDSLFVP